MIEVKPRMIRTDSLTEEKLRKLAGNKSLSAFLRDLANDNIIIKPVVVEVSEIEALRGALLRQVEAIKITQDAINDLLKSLNFRIECAIKGLKNEQDYNDAKDKFLAEKIPGYREVLMQNDASYGLQEQFDSYGAEDEEYDD